MAAQIIFLHGASSSGKSTIARTLQARIEKPFWHISIDHLRDSGVLPLDRFRNGDFKWADARAAFFNGLHASLAAYANAGNNLILEHILDTEGWIESLRNLLAPHDVFFVAVHCSPPLLMSREAARGDRPQGSAKQDLEKIHVGRHYDLEQNSEDGPEVNVEILLKAWRSCRRSSDFSPLSAD
ncbi:chloramphenicol phosphotransferase CPT family protein [Chelativorans salis]|uniref:Chloramphenicol phosphotransferase CPT family protein n=1 Tax=Chelativorans salis TaxID=2978478 RepID=A0ABT2LQK6_9HYPH|nr:chloramphenicol phosphotransferase CPT family protein [Chelativorans sp. EGI FJ00035]MCT7376621.1 chloramphenicol phosphotransferase CPT family protein [Chelativorans sp. EGI FJ00035]